MNLIICITPLNILIAQELRERYPNEDFHGVFLKYNSNEKMDYYIEQFSKFTVEVEVIDCTTRIKAYNQIFRARFSKETYDKVFVAAIDSMWVLSNLSAIHFREIYTYDDGTINLFPEGRYYTSEFSIAEKIVQSLLRFKYNPITLRAISKKHYTIYDAPNIIGNTELIQLVHEKDSNAQPGTSVSILLGQPLYAEDKPSQILFNKIVKKLQPDFYLPHPRETFEVEGVDYVHTNYVLEDYIVHLRNQFETVKLYTVSSSAILNVMQLSRVEVYGIKVDDFESHQDILRRFDVPIIDLEME